MIVISLTDCPPKVRGDLSKWLFEINTGVFVGNLSERVREALWKRICDNLRSGRATMVFTAAGEQHLDFKVHNTTWEPVDFDGIKLMRHPLPNHKTSSVPSTPQNEMSNAAQHRKIKAIQTAKNQSSKPSSYVVIDLETSGLDIEKDDIIEFGALRVRNGKPESEFESFVNTGHTLKSEITELTGITNDMLNCHGISLTTALIDFIKFVGDDDVICHNSAFDFSFLRVACNKCNIDLLSNECTDTLPLAKRKLKGIENYKLTTIAHYLSIDTSVTHRAVADCYLTYEVYSKLNEM